MAVRKTEDKLRNNATRGLTVLLACILLCFAIGCGSAWHGRIVHLEDGKVVIQPQGEGEIKSGRKLLIYREKTITHPITNQVLDNIKDDITEVAVLRARGRTITATVNEPWFSMMMVDDQVKSVRGSVDPPAGSVREVGTIRDVNAAEKIAEVDATIGETISVGDTLTVIKYTEAVFDPDTGEAIAAAIKPVAHLKVTEVFDNKRLKTSYSLLDEKLGWIESGDTVVKLTGDMLTESLWFHDPPAGFSEEWIFGRNYLRAIRHYDSENYREAVLELKDVAKTDPDYRDTSYLLGLCYANLNRHEEAADHFEALLKQKPDDAKTWAALAYAYLKQEKLPEAVRAYEKLANLLPDDPEVLTDIGDIYRTIGDSQKAEQAYKKALEIDENDEEAKHELQRILSSD
ncbi:tetratricopeptide repeat protein [Candidatus Poribacteria bacterium]